jgi:hypothetical protein
VTAGLIPAGILGLASQHPELAAFVMENLNPSGEFNASGFYDAKNYTLVEGIVAFLNHNITSYFQNASDLTNNPISQRVINSDGIMGYHGVPQMPIFAYKAIDDEISFINDTDALVAKYCGIGATIHYERNSVGSHSSESPNGAPRALEFLDMVLSGQYNATGCQVMNVTVEVKSTSSS